MNNEHQTETGSTESNATARNTSDEYDQDLAEQYVRLPMGFILERKRGNLTGRDIFLYCFLLAKQGENKSLYWSLASLKRLTGLPETGLKQSLRALLKSGHIKRKRGKSTSHTICLTKVESEAKETRIFIKGQLTTTHLNKKAGVNAPKPSKEPVATSPLPVISASADELEGQFDTAASNSGDADFQNVEKCPAGVIRDFEPDPFQDSEIGVFQDSVAD